jgi:hypothetical protein
MRIGQKVKWFDPAINDYPIEERETQRNRIYTIVKIINEEMCLIADDFSESEVFFSELIPFEEVIPQIEKFNNSINELKSAAVQKLKEIGFIDFSFLYTETLDEDGDVEDYEDERPQIIVADKHCIIDWVVVESVKWDENRNVIMVYCDGYDYIPVTYAEGLTEIYVYMEILRY